jgi:hypothetical protein
LNLPIRFADDVAFYLVEDEGVVFRRRAQELHALNTTAAFVWCNCEEGYRLSEVAANFAETFSIPPARAESYVKEIVSAWQQLGLLEGSDASAVGAAPPADSGEHPPELPETLKRGTGPCFRHERTYRILGQSFRVRFMLSEQESRIHPVLAHLEVRGNPENERMLDVIAHGADHWFLMDSNPVHRCGELDELAPCAIGCLFPTSVENATPFAALHAGAVSRDRDCLLLAGESGSGKSTLTAALLHAGLEYITDDVVLLDVATGRVRGTPCSLCIKDDGTDHLANFYPEIRNLPTHHRPDGKIVRYLPPPPGAFSNEVETAQSVGWLVFPRYEKTAQSSTRPLGVSEALRRLFPLCAFGSAVTRHDVQQFIDWAGRVKKYEMTVSNLSEGLAMLKRVAT